MEPRRGIAVLILFLAGAASAASDGARAFFLDRDAGSQARLSDSLARLGWRPVSLDASGDPSHPRYASSWVRDGGPAWFHSPAVPASALADSAAAWSRRGWRPALLTGTGAASATGPAATGAAGSLAVIAIRDSAPAWVRAGLDRAAFRALCDSAQRAGYRPDWLDAYGTPAEPRFAGVWVRDAGRVPWNYSLGDDAESLEDKAATFAPVWVRPSLVAPLPDGRLLTLWREDAAGAWSLHPRLPAAGADSLLRAEAREGRHPISLSRSPDGGYVVLTSLHVSPLPRAWTARGPSAPCLAPFDDYMRDLMQAHGVRAGSLAMVKDGRLVLARGYTWAEAGYPLTEPNSLFRVASCSKPLTSMAVHRLLREGGQAQGPLSLGEKVVSLLDPGAPGGGTAPADARFAEITVDDLLSHRAGWIRSPENPDPVFNDYPAGHAIRERLPAQAKDFLGYMRGQPLQFRPGSRSAYANFGYFLLGRILGTLPHGLGRGYERAMADLVFGPLGLSRPRIGGSLLAERRSGEVLYHARYPYLQRGRVPGGPAWVPGAYGDFDLRNMEAAGAWILAATDYAKVLASFDLGADNPVLTPAAVGTMWAPPKDPRFLRGWFATILRKREDGGVETAKWHNGRFPGTSTLVFYRPDRWSFALFLNKDISPQLSGDTQGRELGRLADQVEEWPEIDLFPEVGLQSFAKRGSPAAAPERDHYTTATR